MRIASHRRRALSVVAAKKTLLAYDDTTFYSKLVSGEASRHKRWLLEGADFQDISSHLNTLMGA